MSSAPWDAVRRILWPLFEVLKIVKEWKQSIHSVIQLTSRGEKIQTLFWYSDNQDLNATSEQ